jgi:hypothetical protein
MPRHFIGVDPDKMGAIAVVDEKGEFVAAHPMPIVDPHGKPVLNTHRTNGTYDLKTIRKVLTSYPDAHLTVEAVPAMNKPGRYAALGRGLTEAWVWSCFFIDLPCNTVRPQDWQRALAPGKRRHSKDKAAAIKAATTLFPTANLKRHHKRSKGPDPGICDALLIAEFGRRKHLGLDPAHPQPVEGLDVDALTQKLNALETHARSIPNPDLQQKALDKISRIRNILNSAQSPQ